ncbi:hypothetical protein [Oceanirhabdus sp. W0125-5]|uniref:hypothetical protein n=1 Tax=Oceanirhabdus sp. W0125-5 TaxID=2999116 RepID=UPI0022F32912|nr:hypothetical protein [Oceanirhabdus sp. W0125-5]WBW99217.1 hypothetical protein OW730_10845 [Oceanirhabdus sp. W0125-5]
MNVDLYEYHTAREQEQKIDNKESVFIDQKEINIFLNRPDGYGKDAYWSYYKMGKPLGKFKAPYQVELLPEEVLLDEDILDEYSMIEIESLQRPVGEVFKGPYWTLFNIGKSPSVFKDPMLKEDGNKINKKDQLKLEDFKTE